MEERTGHLYILRELGDWGHVRYVGISVDPAARWSQHKSCAARGDKSKLYNWMRKVGIERVVMEVETTEKVPYETLKELEKNTIFEYRWLEHELLNLTDGGEGFLGGRHSEEFKEWMRERMTGDRNHQWGVRSPETSERNHRLKTGKPGHWAGKTRSGETKRKLSEANRGKVPTQKLTEKTVRNLKADLRDGMWQVHAAEKYGIAKSTVNNIAKGRRWGWVE